MKGLASTSPTFAKVNISGRSARKHYGLDVSHEFLDLDHDATRTYWDAYAGFYRICQMQWFITKA